MGTRLIAVACVLAVWGCSPKEHPPVAPAVGSEMVVYDAKSPRVIGWRDSEMVGGPRYEAIMIPVGTKVRWVDGNRTVAEEPHDMVRIIEGPDRDVTAYLPAGNLRPLPRR